MPGHGKLFPQRARCVQAGIAYRTAARGSQSTLRALPRNRGSIRTSTRLAHANYFPEDLMQIQFSAARPDADFVVLPVEKDGLARTAFGDLDKSAEHVLLAAAKAGRFWCERGDIGEERGRQACRVEGWE